MRAQQPLKSSILLSLWIKKCSIQPSFSSLVFNRDLSILNPFKAVSKNHNLNSCRQMSWEKYEDYLKGSLPARLPAYLSPPNLPDMCNCLFSFQTLQGQVCAGACGVTWASLGTRITCRFGAGTSPSNAFFPPSWVGEGKMFNLHPGQSFFPTCLGVSVIFAGTHTPFGNKQHKTIFCFF